MSANKEPLLKRRNWFLSAGLTFFIYIVLLVFTRNVSSAVVGAVVNFIHFLPLLGVFMIIMGVHDKKRKEEWDRQRKKKRYETTMMLSKIKRRNQGGRPPRPPDRSKDKAPPKKPEGDGS